MDSLRARLSRLPDRARLFFVMSLLAALAEAHSRIRGINVLAKRPPPGQIPIRIKQVLDNVWRRT
jgi:hypothetical protein